MHSCTLAERIIPALPVDDKHYIVQGAHWVCDASRWIFASNNEIAAA